eukprot:tig00000215_g18585.t1
MNKGALLALLVALSIAALFRVGPPKQTCVVYISTRVVTPGGVEDAAVVVSNGTIRAVVKREELAPWKHCLMRDFDDLVIGPGLVDIHVHLNEPGRTHWEGYETGTKAAAAGGVTTIVEMPINSHPAATNASVLREKIAAAAGKIWVDVGFFGGLTSGNAAEMDALIDAGAIAIKAFMVHSGMDDFPEATEADLAAALPALARRNVPLVVHAELKRPGSEPYKFSDPRSYKEYVASRPEQMESDAVDLIIRLVRAANASAAEAGHAVPRVHIAHVSYAGVLDAVRRARQAGLSVTAETCPHYLVFDSEMIQDGQTAFKCAPPIRAAANRELLWASLLEGTLDAVVSDHSPCPPQLKLLTEGDFEKAWGGISSLQLGLSIMWTEGRHRKVTIKDLADWMSTAPARIVGLAGRKGLLAPGYDADIVIWNPEDAFYVGGPGARLFHRHGVTPYFGNALEGRVVATVVRGIPVYLNGTHLAQGFGSVLYGGGRAGAGAAPRA